MIKKAGHSPTFKQRALRAGTDIEDLERVISPGNPHIDKLLVSRRPSAASRASLLDRGKATLGRLRSRVPFVVSALLTSTALTCAAPAARAASSDPLLGYPTMVEIVARIDWAAVIHSAWVALISCMVGALAFTQWRHQLALALPYDDEAEGSVQSDVASPPELADGANIEELATGDSEAITPGLNRHWVFGETRTGLFREENQDAFEVRHIGPSNTVFCVCDGVGGVPGGRDMAGRVSKAIVEHAAISIEQATDDQDSQSLLLSSVAAIRQQARDEGWSGLTTLILAHIKDKQLSFVSLGDGALSAIFPDGSVGHLLVPHHRFGTASNVITGYIGDDCNVAARGGSFDLEAGTMVIAMSDGVSNIVNWEQLLSNRDALARSLKSAVAPDNPANEILDQLESARDPNSGALLHSDNMTLVMALVDEAYDG